MKYLFFIKLIYSAIAGNSYIILIPEAANTISCICFAYYLKNLITMVLV